MCVMIPKVKKINKLTPPKYYTWVYDKEGRGRKSKTVRAAEMNVC